ncbi:MAPEG family protein [Halobacteriovorax marinus]|uniref:MAPEG family protein n=1 Tax=Halobacteriovorax marinus TaxID=97084 RepID=UPI003A91D427
MSNPQIIFVPCLILILLTFLVLNIMFNRRMRGLKKGEITPGHFKTYSTGQTESVKTIQAQRNFSNLQEAPPLFYFLCLITFVTGNVTPLMMTLAWLFLASRIIHTLVHITTNKLPLRMLSFGAGWLILVLMSINLLIKFI